MSGRLVRALGRALRALVGVAILGWASPSRTEIVWIAHALGGIDGRDYTNSAEAFALNYERGFRVFEVDLMLTADGQICAFHSLDSMNREFGLPQRVVEVPQALFLQQRYYQRYHPLCADELRALILRHPNARFVLDIKDSRNTRQREDLQVYEQAYRRIYDRLLREWAASPQIWDQILPQIYREPDLAWLLDRHPFPRLIYSLYRTPDDNETVLRFVRANPSIWAVAVERRRFDPRLASAVARLGRGLFVYTVNDEAELRAYLSRGATGFYTDFHPPRLAPMLW